MTDLDDVRQAVEGVLPAVDAHADTTYRDRRLPDEVVDALAGTGINRLLLPTELGGIDAGVDDLIEITSSIAAVDGSTAWCAVIGAGSNLFAGYLPPDGARRVFADPDQGSATMLAPAGTLDPAADGHRLSGRWPFTSNCLHSDWLGLGAVQAGADDPRPRVAFVPRADVTIEDTWDSTGLRGTGSHDVVVEGAVVDDAHWCILNGPTWPDGRLWRMPIASVYVPLLAAVTLGIARGALDEIGRQAVEGRSARRGQVTEDPTALADLAEAETHLRGAAAGLREAVLAADAAARRRDPIPRALQAHVVLAAHAANDAAVQVTATAHRLGGGGAAYGSSPLLRALDDVHVARQHLMLARLHRADLMKALLGLDVAHPPLVI